MLKQIKLSLGRTLNMGNYQSMRADVEIVSAVNEDDDFDEIYEKTKREVQKKLDDLTKSEHDLWRDKE